MSVYEDIPGSEIAIDEAVKSLTATKFRENPLAIFEGDPTAIAAGKALSIDRDLGAGSQTAIITDELDTDKSLTPDGLGGAKWTAGVSGMVLVERKELAVAATSVSFAGLDGDTEEVYKMIGRINKAPVGVGFIAFGANGGVIGNGRDTVNAVTGTFVLGRFIGATALAASFLAFECLIHARETVQAVGMPRFWNGKASEFDGVNVSQLIEYSALWSGAGNIVSLEVTAQTANALGVGSTFELFKLSQ